MEDKIPSRCEFFPRLANKKVGLFGFQTVVQYFKQKGLPDACSTSYKGLPHASGLKSYSLHSLHAQLLLRL